MKIANEATFREFDRMRENIFHKKHEDFKAKNQVKNPISLKIRILYPLALIAGGLWLVYRNMPSLRDMLISKEMISYQELLAFDTIKTSLKCRWKQRMENPKQKIGHRLFNDLYVTKLESDFFYLSEKREQKNINIQMKTNISWWTFNFGNHQTIHFINQYGDLMIRERDCKVMLGNSLRIWNKTQDKLIKRQHLFKLYEKQREKIGSECERINWTNKMFLKSQQYEQLLTECKNKSKIISEKINSFIERRLEEEKRKKIQNLQAN